MSHHRNAKLGLSSRYSLLSAIAGGMTPKAAAAAFSVAPATFGLHSNATLARLPLLGFTSLISFQLITPFLPSRSDSRSRSSPSTSSPGGLPPGSSTASASSPAAAASDFPTSMSYTDRKAPDP